MRKFFFAIMSIFLLLTITFISANAGTLYGPQDLDGLQTASITYSTDGTNYFNLEVNSDVVESTTVYTSGLDLGKLIELNNFGYYSTIFFRFYWPTTYDLKFNELAVKNVPNNFNVEISCTGTSSMTGENYTAAYTAVNQYNGWTRFDNYSFSASQSPLLRNVNTLTIKISSPITALSTLYNTDFILSLSLYPYTVGATEDYQYDIGYSDAAKYYTSIINDKTQEYYDRGRKLGYEEGYLKAEDELVPVAYDQGRSDGYTVGFNDGRQEAEQLTEYDLKDLFFIIPQSHLSALSGFLNWQFLGFNLYELLGGFVVILLVAILLRFGIKFIF